MSTNIPITSGYTCSNCSTWVPFGSSHSCEPQPTYVNPWVYSTPIDNTVFERIAKALERIADTLDR